MLAGSGTDHLGSVPASVRVPSGPSSPQKLAGRSHSLEHLCAVARGSVPLFQKGCSLSAPEASAALGRREDAGTPPREKMIAKTELDACCKVMSYAQRKNNGL